MRERVIAVSRWQLVEHDGWRGLFHIDLSELRMVCERGDANAVRLKVALELGRCLAAFSPDDRPGAGTPDDVGQRPFTGGTPAENPDAVVAESGCAGVGARRECRLGAAGRS